MLVTVATWINANTIFFFLTTSGILFAENFKFKAYRTILICFMAIVTLIVWTTLYSIADLITRGGRSNHAPTQIIHSSLLIRRFLTFEGHLAGFGHDKVG